MSVVIFKEKDSSPTQTVSYRILGEQTVPDDISAKADGYVLELEWADSAALEDPGADGGKSGLAAGCIYATAPADVAPNGICMGIKASETKDGTTDMTIVSTFTHVSKQASIDAYKKAADTTAIDGTEMKNKVKDTGKDTQSAKKLTKYIEQVFMPYEGVTGEGYRFSGSTDGVTVLGLFSKGAFDASPKEAWVENKITTAIQITGASALATSAAALGALLIAF